MESHIRRTGSNPSSVTRILTRGLVNARTIRHMTYPRGGECLAAKTNHQIQLGKDASLLLDVITALPLSHTTRVVWLSGKAVMTSSKSDASFPSWIWWLVFAAKHSPPLGYVMCRIVLAFTRPRVSIRVTLLGFEPVRRMWDSN